MSEPDDERIRQSGDGSDLERLAAIRRRCSQDVQFYLERHRSPPGSLLDTMLLIAEIDRLSKLANEVQNPEP